METCAWCEKELDLDTCVRVAVVKKDSCKHVFLCNQREITQYCTFKVLGGKAISYDHFFNKEGEPTRFFRGKKVTAILERITGKGYILWTVPEMHHDAERLV